MDIEAMDIEEDILDYEPEEVDGTETTELRDLESIPTSPVVTSSSLELRTGVDEPNLTSRKESNDNNDHCSSALPASGTAANPSKPVFSPKVTINLQSFFTEINTDLNSKLRADETNACEVDGECFANAPTSPILNTQYPKVSFDAKRSFFNKKEGPDSDASKLGSPQCSSPLSMHTSKVSYKSSTSLSRGAVPNHAVTGMRCSPKVTFNPSSLICSTDPQTASEYSDGLKPYVPANKVITIRWDPSSTLGSRSVSRRVDEQLSPADTTLKKLDSDASKAFSKVCLHNEKETPETKFSRCSPKVTFNPSSLIFSTDPQTASEYSDGLNPDVPAQKVITTHWNPASPLGSRPVSSRDDEQLPPDDTTSRNLDSDASKAFSKVCLHNEKETPETTFSRCSPKVIFNPSSLIFSTDPQTASEYSDGLNPDVTAQKVITTHWDPASPLGSRSVFRRDDEQLSPADTTLKNLDSDASKVCLHNEKETPETKFSRCSPKVTFNPSSLICSTDPQAASNCVESPNPLPDASVQIVTNICFNPSSLLDSLSLSSSDDELQLLPVGDTSKNLDSDQASSSNPQNNGFENSGPVGSSGGLHGILKLKKALSPNEKIVTNCLKLLCKTANDDRHQVSDMIRSSAKEVFKNLCFEQFFQKGECISSSCDDNHHYKSHIFTSGNEELWNASLYVICHAATPNLQVVENLVQHYTAKGNTIRSLLLAKCIAKVKDADRLELAHFIVNKLSGTIPPRDVITVMLMLNFSVLSSLRYNTLMEGLGVFEQNTTHYSELMDFLNFHEHKMPARLLVKLMEDSIKYSGEGSFVESVSGFVKRLHPSQKSEIQPTVNDFEEQFRILPATDNNEDSQDEQPPQKRSKTGKKKVSFAADPEVCEFEVAACPREIQCEVEDPVFSDEDCEDDDEQRTLNFYGLSEPRKDIIKRVFGGLCRTLILHGHCSNAMCDLTHDFGKDYFAGLSSEDVRVAADFIIDQSKTPSFEILKIFIELFAESLQSPVELSEIARILKFRKFSLKLSTSNSLKLTRMVLSVLSKQIGLWDAIEKVLVPIPVELEDPEDGRFLLDEELIYLIIREANTNKSAILRCVSRAIMEQMAMLPQGNSGELVELATLFVEKFIITGREVEPFPDILPVKTIQTNRFASEFKVALYQGVPSKYFMAAIMMKQAVNSSLKDRAVDVLYTFLLGNFDRARVLTHLFDNCRYFDRSTNSSVRELFGTVALKTAIRLYESENFAGTAELFTILEQEKLKLNIFVLLAKLEEKMTELDLATIYCSVKVDTVVNREYLIKMFLDRCVDPVISAGSECPPAVMKLTAKMFRVFTSGLLVEETLELYKGITSRQKSLVRPFNIVEFVEPTLRCTFNRLCDDDIRRESFLLYIDVVDSETPVAFQKVTHRSMFLIAVMLITHASQEFELKGHINIIQPVIKKMLVTCIKEGLYFDLRTSDIVIYSSMTAKEIEVYVLWWFFLHVRARKRRGCDYFYPITVRILQDCIQDNSNLPLHPSLRNVSVSITDCAERVTSVIKNSIAEPIAIITGRERGVFQLHPATVRAMSQTACNIMLQHGYITAETDRMCTFCFDKLNVQLAEQLP